MKKVKVIIASLCGVMLMSSCSTVGSGAVSGAYLGGMFGSAMGGMMGGFHGRNVGTVLGMATGAAAGAAIGAANEQRREERREAYLVERDRRNEVAVRHYRSHVAPYLNQNTRYGQEQGQAQSPVQTRGTVKEVRASQLYANEQQKAGIQSQQYQQEYDDSGFDATNSGDDRIYDFKTSEK